MEDLDPRDVAQDVDDMVRGRGFVHETLVRLVEEARVTVGDDGDLITEMVLRRLSTDPALAKVDEAFTLMQRESIVEDLARDSGWSQDPDTGVWRRPPQGDADA